MTPLHLEGVLFWRRRGRRIIAVWQRTYNTIVVEGPVNTPWYRDQW